MSNLRKRIKSSNRLSDRVYKPLVYICAPYSGDIEKNIELARDFARFVYDTGAIPLTPHVLFPFLDDKNAKEREDAMFMDTILLGKCDEVWVLSDNITKGMESELEVSKRRKQKIRYFNRDFMEVDKK